MATTTWTTEAVMATIHCGKCGGVYAITERRIVAAHGIAPTARRDGGTHVTMPCQKNDGGRHNCGPSLIASRRGTAKSESDGRQRSVSWQPQKAKQRN